MNIVEPILFQARHQPEAPALCAQGNDVITYAQLRAQMHNIARRAMSFGLRRGNIVALLIADSLQHAVAILGLTQAGIVPVTVGSNPPPPGLKVDAVIRSGHYPFASAARHFPFDFTWLMGDGALAVEAWQGGSASDICRIVLTSGTTGGQKAVALTHKLAVERNARFEFLAGNRLPLCSRVYLNIGLGSSLGYYFLTYILGRGGTLFFRGQTLENTLRSFDIFKVQFDHPEGG